jgi:hypothetical protein
MAEMPLNEALLRLGSGGQPGAQGMTGEAVATLALRQITANAGGKSRRFGVSLEKWRAFGFGLCGGLEIAWAFVAERRMSPHRIIEPVDVASNGNFGR